MSLRSGSLASRVHSLGPRLLAWLLPLCLLAGWFALAMGPLRIGPADWDDTMYADRAITGGFVWDVRNRYVHVWAMRILDRVLATHVTAAAAWAALCVCGLGALGFYAGKRLAGPAGGLLALASMLMFPPMLKYLSVPHVDLSMALFSMLAVLAAALAVDTPHVALARAAALASGLFGYLALKSKETGLVVPPLSAYLLLGRPLRLAWPRYAAWALGLCLGFALLFTLDRSFVRHTEARPSDPRNYFAPAPVPEDPKPKSTQPAPRAPHDAEVVDALMAPAYSAFTLLGCAGFVRGARRSIWARALGLWALSVTVFTALISSRYHGIDAQDRYLVAIGAGLAPLAAYWVIALAREPGRQVTPSWFFLGLLAATTAPALWGLWGVQSGDDTGLTVRASQLAVPLAMLLLFLAAWLAPRWAATPAALLLLAMSALIASQQARAYREQKRHEFVPWNQLVARLDEAATPPRIAVLHGRSYRANRLRWRLRVLSRQPLLETRIRDVEQVEQIAPGEWVFVGAAHERALEDRNYQRILELSHDPRPWTLYAPP